MAELESREDIEHGTFVPEHNSTDNYTRRGSMIASNLEKESCDKGLLPATHPPAKEWKVLLVVPPSQPPIHRAKNQIVPHHPF